MKAAGSETQRVAQGSPEAQRDHFLKLSPGALTGLRQITDAKGRFKVLALDQSNSFKKSLRAMRIRLGQAGEPTYEEIRDAKLEIAATLGGYASATLLDVNYGLRQALNAGAIPRGIGLLARVEASKEAGLPGEVEPGWGVVQIKRMGASAVKLLVYMDVEDEEAAKAQLRFVHQIWKQCQEQDILLLVEELSYPRAKAGEDKTTPAYVARRPRNIIESAKLLGPWCDVLKLEFPGDLKTMDRKTIEANLTALNDAAIRPWVLLSAGEKFDLFVQQVELAMRAGASGIMAGRAIFNEYFDANTPADRTRFLQTTGVERMKKLTGIVDQYATSWIERYRITPTELAAQVVPDWHLAGVGGKARAAATAAGGEEY
ncbi:MAG: tagatose 1,6-diphosphate aldolase [Elusimicrobia bacterium]|nr:tagatose 1,6-diphosphate aldolase [Elusimicrobiota bacterium]